MRTALFDSSAILQVVFGQPEAAGITSLAHRLLERKVRVAISALAEVECHRAALRMAQLRGQTDYDQAAVNRLLSAFDLINIERGVLNAAIGLRPFLKTLDSIHLATALRLGTELEGLVTFDSAMKSVAAANSIKVLEL
jgi:predicted nucleic acid-binding protein